MSNDSIRINFEFLHFPVDFWKFGEDIPLDQEQFLKYIKLLCSSKFHVDFDHQKIHFMYGTRKIKEFDTPRRLYMTNGDLVKVIFKAQGKEAEVIFVEITQDMVEQMMEQMTQISNDRNLEITPDEQVLLADKGNPIINQGDDIEIKNESKKQTFNKENVKFTYVEIEKLERQTEAKHKENEARPNSVTDIIREEDVKENSEADEDIYVDFICNLAKNGYNRKTSIMIWIVNKLLLLSKIENQRHERLEFRVNTHFSKFKQWYSDHVNYPDNYLTLRFNGKEIKDEETPEDLKMKDNDVIEVHFAVPIDEKNRKIFLHKQRR